MGGALLSVKRRFRKGMLRPENALHFLEVAQPAKYVSENQKHPEALYNVVLCIRRTHRWRARCLD